MKKTTIHLLIPLLLIFVVINGCKKESGIDGSDEAPIRPITSGSNAYVTTLFEYLPAPGQLVNTNAGTTAAAESILGKKGLISLGAWGGYIILGFDHTVINESGKDDIILFGNPNSMFAEPGVVWVMQDENGNGKPDDTWYEAAGSEHGKEGYIRDYSVTYTRPNPAGDVSWKDNKGNTGVVKTNSFHIQPYYPAWIIADSYTISGTLLPKRNIDDSVPTFIKSLPFEFGYADNAVGGDKIDIDRAINKDGKKISLKGIDFIKIQTGIQYNMGMLGELSTEVQGVADLNLYKE